MKTEKVRVGDLVIDQKLTEMRPINVVFVSRYRQAYREGANMPRLIVEDGTYRIVSGNHRATAMIEEFGEDHEITVELRQYDSELALLKDFAKENVSHGVPLEGISRRYIAQALISEGASTEEVASLFGVAVQRITEWCGMSVLVVGKRSKSGSPKPFKNGPEILGETITSEQWETHMEHDRGLRAYAMAEQLSRWLKNGWIKSSDSRSVAALEELAGDIDLFINSLEEVGA